MKTIKQLRSDNLTSLGEWIDKRFMEVFLEAVDNYMPPVMCLHCNPAYHEGLRPGALIMPELRCEYCLDLNREPIPMSELE